MTRNVTFQGRSTIPLPDGSVLVGALDDREQLTLLRQDSAGGTVWTADLGDLGEDPSLRYSDSRTGDYGCLYWPAADTLVVVGDTEALLLDAATGEVTATFELRPVGKSSLEISGVFLVPAAEQVVIVSAKRVWVIGPDLVPVCREDAEPLLAEMPRVEDGILALEEWDFESPSGGTNTRRVPLT